MIEAEETPLPKPASDPPLNWLSRPEVEQLPKIAGLIAISLYGLGLLVANVYLFGLGVTDYAALRVRYIIIGFAAMIPLAAAATLSISALAVSRDISSRSSAKSTGTAGEKSFVEEFVLATGSIYFVSVVAYVLGIALSERLVDYATVIAMAATFIGVCMTLFSKFREGVPGIIGSRLRLGWILFTCIVGGLSGFVYVSVLASRIFPTLPEQFGGGRPKIVELIFAKGSEPLAIRLGITEAEHLSLLWETENVYVVREAGNDDAPVLQIDRDAVSAVVLLTNASDDIGSPTADPATPTAP